MIAKKIYEKTEFIRGGHPYDTLKIGKAELRILNKLTSIVKKLGLKDAGIEDLNKKKAIASWRLPEIGGYKGGRVTLFRNDKSTIDFDYGIFIMGKKGTDIQDWKNWDTLEKWMANIGFMFESQNFQRGKHPMGSLDIGLRYRKDLQPGDEFLVYNKNGKNWDHMVAVHSPTPYLMIMAHKKDGSWLLEATCIWNEKKKRWEYISQLEIKESIEFQRGKDPIDALDLGIKNSLKTRSMGIGAKDAGPALERIWNDIANALDEESYDNVFSLGKPLPEGNIPAIPKEIAEKIEPYVFSANSAKASSIFSKGTGNQYQVFPTPWGKILREFVMGSTVNYYVNYETAKALGLYKYPVNESIDFQRGEDPKDAMKIGKIANSVEIEASPYINPSEIISYLNDSSRDCGIMFKYFENGDKHVVTLADLRENHPDVIFRGKYYNLRGNPVKESAEFIRGEDPIKSMDIGIRPIEIVYAESYIGNHSEPTPMNHRRIRSALRNWIPGQMGDWSFWGTNHKFFLAEELEGKWVKFKGELYKLGGLDESADFVRGLDPKSALDIGLPSKMGQGYKVLWRDKKNKWSIERYTNPHTQEPNLVIVSDDYIDYPILYSDGRIAYDDPYRLPKDIKDRAHKLYRKIKGFNESVSFERGKEPKEAIGIGNKDIQIADKIDKVISQLGFQRRPEISVSPLNHVQDIAEWWGPRGEICIFYRSLEDDIDHNISNKYLITVTNKKGTDYDMSEDEFYNVKIWHNILSDRPMKWNVESVSFERGIDPEEVLRVGKWHRKKIEKELRKVIKFFNEPWLEEVLPEYIDKIEKLGIELYSITPYYHRGVFDYQGKSLLEISWRTSDGKNVVDAGAVHKQPDFSQNFKENEGKNVLYPVIDILGWHEHNLMK